MEVPFLDLTPMHNEMKSDLQQAFDRVLKRSSFISGPELEAFENEFAQFTDAKFSIGLGNGLDAISLALKALDIGAGDEVIVPAHTFIASWLGVSYAGATPVPVEVDEKTYNIDPDKIEAAITSRTKAIMPVHLYGQPANLTKIYALAEKHKLLVIEDAAQAHGATFAGQKIGAQAVATCYSFYPGKNLGALGDAGAVTTNDAKIAERLKMIRNYGSAKKYVHDVQGVNSRLDELQAAFLREKLKRLAGWNKQRQQLADKYSKLISEKTKFKTPFVAEGAESAWHLYVIRSDRRDELQKHLASRGVGTLVHYPIPSHKSGAYSAMSHLKFPLTETICREVLSLPFWPQMTNEQTIQVVEALATFPR